MSDGTLDGIFLIVHRTFLLNFFFGGCRLVDFLCECPQIMWTYIEVAIELAVAVFIKRLQQHASGERLVIKFG